MVLIDEQDNELWLTGTPCGYAGEGPAGAETILRAEGFGDAAEAVYDRRLVRVVLRKDGGAITSELTERGTTLWDGGNNILRWLWRQRRVQKGADLTTEVARLTWDNPLAGTPDPPPEPR